MTFQFLFSADMMVADPDGMTELLHHKLGIYRHPRWRQAFDNHPYIAHFLRVHRSMAVAPTRVEPQVHLDRPNPGDPMFHEYLESLKDFQGRRRPMLTHAIVIAMFKADLDRMIDRLMQRGLAFRLAQRTEEMPYDRLWLGVTPENPRYDPSVDGGLCIELHPIEPLQMPPETFTTPPPRIASPEPGEMARVTARGFLLRDLDGTLRRLAANLDWSPHEPTTVLQDDGCRRARLRFAVPNSAALDLLQPTHGDSEYGRYLNSWGPGPLYIRIGVHGLEAKAEDLRRRGVRFTHVPSARAVEGRSLLRVDPAELQGQHVEFEEA